MGSTLALKDKLPELDGGPWLHKGTKGNLFFDKPIKGGPKVKVETMLGFELAIYLRMHTEGRANSPVSRIMPSYGEPCFQIVAAFCHAVFGIKLGIDFDAKLIGDNVRDLKGAILHEWQAG